MKKIIITTLLIGLTFISTAVQAEEKWGLTLPGEANISHKAYVSHDWLKLYVPKSFKGRRVDKNITTVGVEFNKLIRYQHSGATDKLKGMVNQINYKYKADAIDLQIFRSKDLQPGFSSCMDCHGTEIPRTTVIAGYSKSKVDEYSYAGFPFKKSETSYGRIVADHWMTNRLMLKGEVRLGKVKQGSFTENAKSFSLGLGGRIGHRVVWSGDWVCSKVDTLKARNTLIGKLTYRIKGGFKFRLEAGAFLNGYTQFGTEISELGGATSEAVRDYYDYLPSLFKKLKDDSFGYYKAGLEYEYFF